MVCTEKIKLMLRLGCMVIGQTLHDMNILTSDAEHLSWTFWRRF